LPIFDENPRLPGTWAGLLTATVTVADSYDGPLGFVTSEPEESTIETRVAIRFDEGGVPDRLLVYRVDLPGPWETDRPAVMRIEAVLPGETATVTITEGFLPNEVITYTVTVREANYTPTHGQVVLDMTTTWDLRGITHTSSSHTTGSASSTQALELAWDLQGEQLSWHQTAETTAHSLRIDCVSSCTGELRFEYWSTQSVISTGTLTYRPEE
jgi:hypothetical protein